MVVGAGGWDEMTVGQSCSWSCYRGSSLKSFLVNQDGLSGRGNPALGALELRQAFVSG